MARRVWDYAWPLLLVSILPAAAVVSMLASRGCR